MTDPIEQIRQKLVDHVAQIIDHHHATGVDVGSDVACNSGAQGISQHSRHVPGQIMDKLGLKEIDEVKKPNPLCECHIRLGAYPDRGRSVFSPGAVDVVTGKCGQPAQLPSADRLEVRRL